MDDLKTTQLLRLSYAEMTLIGCFLDMAIKEHPKSKGPIRMILAQTAREKIWKALEQAEKDGLVDTAKVRDAILRNVEVDDE